MSMNKKFLAIVTILGLTIMSIPAMAQPSLVASYPFNGNANDESGNGHDGTNDGARLSTDRFGNTDASYYFDGTYLDGSGTTINVASSPAFGPDSGVIVDLWIRPTAYPDLVGTDWEYHKGILWTTSESSGFAMWLNADSTIAFAVAPSWPWVEVTSQTRVPLNVWTHLRGTYQRSTGIIRLFVNDLLEDETVSNNRVLGEVGLVIGRNPFAWDLDRPAAFQGEIDDLKIWDWSESLLMAFYPFTGSAYDYSGRGHDGTVNGAVLSTDRFDNPDASYDFDGVNDFISVPASPDFGPDSGIIIDLWIRPTSYPDLAGTGWEYHKMILSTTTDAFGFEMALYADSLVSFAIAPYPWAHAYSQTRVPLNQWTNLRGTFHKSTGTIQIYVNGALEGETNAVGTALGTTGFVIGKNPLSTDPDRPFAFAGKIDDIKIWNWSELSSDTLRIGNATCLQSLLPAEQAIPIYLDNPDTVKGFDIPMSYTWSVDPDSISFVGTRLSGIQGALRSIDAGANRMRLFWTWSGDPNELLLPSDVSNSDLPIAKIFMPATYACVDDFVNPPDTSRIVLPLGAIGLEVADKNGAATIPVVIAGNTLIRHYLKGDANWDQSVSISDPVYIINYIFAVGAVPYCTNAGDADGSGVINIADVVFLINYVFAGGPTPGADDLCSPPPSFPKAAIGHANIATRFSANETSTAVAVSLGNSSDARAIQLDFAITGDVRNIQINSDVSELQLFSSEVDGGYRIGLIDLTGTAAIPPGTSQIATITYEGTGELAVTSAIVVDNDASEMNVTIANAKVESVLPTEYSLSQNQPNPFNPSTDISFSLSKTGPVKLMVYNILGAEVATLVDEVRSAGVHRVTWDGRDNSGNLVASGIYLYRLTAGDFAATKKMMLLK